MTLTSTVAGDSHGVVGVYPPLRRGAGLSSTQAWTHDHITRCGCCGAWQLVTEMEARVVASDLYDPPARCRHYAEQHDESEQRAASLTNRLNQPERLAS